MWPFSRKGASGFSSSSTAEEVTQGIDGTGLTAIVTDAFTRLGADRHIPSFNPNRVDIVRFGLEEALTALKRVSKVKRSPYLCIEILHTYPMWDVTGASSGIGTETTRVLALCGVHVVMGVRNMAAGQEVKEAIVKEIPTAEVDVMELDLSSMASVRKFASEFNSSGLPLNILINNAGTLGPYMLSKDNIEMLFATNHLGHFLLTSLLLDTMKKTTEESGKEGRIVIVSSVGHRFTYRGGIRFDNINDKSGYSSPFAYGQSKLANVLHANELARRFKEDGVDITANSLHPGAIVTNIFRHSSIVSGLVNMVGKYVLKNVQQGAATTCYVALHPQVKGVSGQYFSDCNIAKPGVQAKDPELAKKLWEFSMSLISE